MPLVTTAVFRRWHVMEPTTGYVSDNYILCPRLSYIGLNVPIITFGIGYLT